MKEKQLLTPKIYLAIGMAILGYLLYLGAGGSSYYRLAAEERPLNALHEQFRSSGRIGLTCGLAGAALMLFNLSYLGRKQFPQFQSLGHLRSWMAFHVMTGLTAGSLVILHSALWLHSVLGVLAFWATGIVVLTGLVGRYIYAHTPRSLEGKELELADIRRRLEGYRQSLEKMGMSMDFFAESVAAAPASDRGIFGALAALVTGDRELHQELKRLRIQVAESTTLRRVAREILPLASRYVRERQWQTRYTELRALMGGWRFFHRWLAILLITTTAFHIMVAVRMGDLWIFQVLR